MRVLIARSVIVFVCMFLLVAGPTVNAEKLERHSEESLWLSQAVNTMHGFLNMLEPVYQVTHAMVSPHPDADVYKDNAGYAIDSARDRLSIIHDNAVWMIDMLPAVPQQKSKSGAKLISEVGDLRARAEDIRLMTETVIANFESAVAGDNEALDQGILEAVALLDTLGDMHDVVADIEMAWQVNAHPIMDCLTLTDKATIQAVINMRQLEFLTSTKGRRPEFDRVLKEFTASIKDMREGSAEIVRLGTAHRKSLMSSGATYRQSEVKIVDGFLATESARGDLIKGLELLVFQLSRTDTDDAALSMSFQDTLGLVRLLDPAERSLDAQRKDRNPPPAATPDDAQQIKRANL